MKLITIFLLLILILLFSACSKCEPKIETVFIKSKVPKLKILYKVEPYELSSIVALEDGNLSVSKNDLEEASKVCQKRIRIINFYEKQNMRFNREFYNE